MDITSINKIEKNTKIVFDIITLIIKETQLLLEKFNYIDVNKEDYNSLSNYITIIANILRILENEKKSLEKLCVSLNEHEENNSQKYIKTFKSIIYDFIDFNINECKKKFLKINVLIRNKMD